MAPFPDYPLPADEEERLRTLERVLLLDKPADEHLDRITELAAAILDKPIALISLVDQHRQRFLSRQGLDALETPRELAFCAHAVAGREPLVVPDASLDPRFSTNPLVLGDPSIRFYAGMPLLAPNGQPLGTLCVIDRQPGNLSDQQLHLLQLLAAQVTREVALREMSSHCLLTGLFHRAPFLFLAGKEFERARRTDTSLALVSVAAPHLESAAKSAGQDAVERLLIGLGRTCGPPPPPPTCWAGWAAISFRCCSWTPMRSGLAKFAATCKPAWRARRFARPRSGRCAARFRACCQKTPTSWSC